MKTELKNSVTQLENSGESITSRMDQTENRLIDLEGKAGELDHVSQEYERNMQEMWGAIARQNIVIIARDHKSQRQWNRPDLQQIILENIPQIKKRHAEIWKRKAEIHIQRKTNHNKN